MAKALNCAGDAFELVSDVLANLYFLHAAGRAYTLIAGYNMWNILGGKTFHLSNASIVFGPGGASSGITFRSAGRLGIVTLRLLTVITPVTFLLLDHKCIELRLQIEQNLSQFFVCLGGFFNLFSQLLNKCVQVLILGKSGCMLAAQSL